MKQTIDPRLGALIAIVGVLLLISIGAWVWMRPTSTPAVAESPAPKIVVGTGGARPAALSEKSKAMFDAHQTTADDRREAEEFRRKNPGATTRF